MGTFVFVGVIRRSYDERRGYMFASNFLLPKSLRHLNSPYKKQRKKKLAIVNVLGDKNDLQVASDILSKPVGAICFAVLMLYLITKNPDGQN